MASLSSFINPDKEKLLQESTEAANVEQTQPSGPDIVDNFTSAYSSGYMRTIGVSGIAIGVDYFANGFNAPEYSQEQLSQLYPDVPPEVFTGGARAYQAEFLVDKYKRQDEARQIQEFVNGVTDPNASIASTVGRNAVSFMGELSGGFADIANIPISITGGALLNGVTKISAPILSKLAPSAYMTVMNTVANSRFLSNIVPEISANLAADIAITYPTQNYLLSDYTKDKMSLQDVALQSLGSAVLFGVARGVFKGKNVEFGQNAWDSINDGLKAKVVNNGDIHSVYTGSDTHKSTMLNVIMGDTIVNGKASKQSAKEILAEKAFKNTAGDIPDSGVFALTEKTTKETNYVGNRYGDNLVFIDSPGAIKGMADVYSTGGAKSFDVYTINTDNYKLADLAQEKLGDHSDLLDVIEARFGSSSLALFDENSSIQDLYEMISNSKISQENTGADIAAIYDQANNTLKAFGFDGIVHTNKIGDAHRTVEIFQDKVKSEDLIKAGEIDGVTTETPGATIVNPRNEDIVLSDGQKIVATQEVVYDSFYDDDPEVSSLFKSQDDPNWLKESLIEDFGVLKVEEFEKQLDDIFSYDNLGEAMSNPVTGPKSETKGIQKQIEEAKEKYKKDPSEKQEEIVKALENCLRKNT